MNYSAPITKIVSPKYHESSTQRSIRDSDGVGKSWVKSKKEQSVMDEMGRAVSQVSREVQKLKRRIAGGGTSTDSTTGGNWNYRGSYDPAETYMTFDVVLYGSGTASGMYLSLTDNPTTAPDSGIGWQQISTASGNWL